MTTNTRNRGKALLALVALATLFAFSLAGCKNFMKNDDDVKETMQQEVDVANAPEVSVRVQSSSDSLGAVTPNGPVTFKVNVPSNVLASEVTGGFIKWAAFYSGDMGTEVADAVTFADAKAKETPATLLVNRPDVVIQAMFEKRPQVSYYFPDPLNGDAYTNSPIRITFSKPIDPATLTSTVDGKAVSNISFTQYFAGITTDITSTNYGAGSLSSDGKVIVFKNIAEMLPRSTMTVKVAKAVRDTSGLEMADDYSFNFKVGTSKDADPPRIGAIIAGLDANLKNNFASAEADRRITASQGPVYVSISGDDQGAGIVTATITPTLTKYDGAGNVLGTVAYVARTIPWIADAGTTTSFSVADLTAGDAGDGLMTLSVVLEDGNENKTNPPVAYRFVRDTAAPPVDPTQLARIVTSGGTGFYNRSSKIDVSNAVPVVDAGFAGDANVPRLGSASVKYYVSLNYSDFAAIPDGKWIDAGKNTEIYLSSYTGPDGSTVPVYVQLKDDLNNKSIPTQFRTVPVDNNPPMAGSISITNSFALNGLKFVSGGSLAYTIKATDGISGVAKYCVKPKNEAPNDGEWQNCSTGADGALTLTGSETVADTNGPNYLYAWFTDGAGNKTTIAVTDKVICDNEKPTVSDFYLRERRKAAFGAPTDTEAATQYSNDKSFYFMFIASDTASGFSTFTYTDDKGGTSVPIAMQSAASAGSGEYAVTNLNVAPLASKDGIPSKVLVTGILTIPANNSEHKLTVKVKDGANNESAEPPYISANRIIFDSQPPEITSFTYDTGATSGYYQSGTNLYTSLANPKVSITANDTGSGVVSGLMDAILSCSSGDWSASSPVSFSLNESLASDTKTTALTVGSSATATFSATPRDYAGNQGTVKTITLIKDQTPPTLALYLYPPSPAPTSAADAKVVKKADSTETIDCSAATHDFTEFYVGMIGYDDGGSGINGARVHSYDVIKRTKAGDSTVSSGKLIISANEKITPDAALFGKNNSAVWLVRVKAKDNVGMEMDHFESVGYTYDITPPAIDNDSLIVSFTENGEMTGKKMSMPASSTVYAAGQYYFIPSSGLPSDKKVYLRIKATDKPSADENGSGLDTVNGNFTIWDIGKSTTRTSGANIATGEPSASYVTIAPDSTKSISLSGVAMIMSVPTFTDKCGNAANGGAFVVAVDDGLPTATPTFTSSSTGKVAGAKYLSNSSTMSLTTTDPESIAATFYTRASGTCGYFLSNLSTPPDVPPSGLGLWSSCSDGNSETIFAASLKTAIGEGTKDLYLHLLDNAGNRNTIPLGKFRIDETAPSLTGISITCPKGAVYPIYDDVKKSDVYYITDSAFDLNANAADDEYGSGLAKYTVESRTITVGQPSWGATASNEYVLTSEGKFQVSGASYSMSTVTDQQFRIILEDKVGNKTPSAATLAASPLEVRLDNLNPIAAASLVSPYLDGGATTYISDETKLSLSLSDPSAGSSVASGIKGWIIQQAGTAKPTKDSAWTPYTGNAATDDENATKALYTLVEASSAQYVLYTIDNVDHVSDAGKINGDDTLMVDALAPVITVTASVSSNIGADGKTWYVGASPKISFKASDNAGGSGLNMYYFSLNAEELAETVNAGNKSCSATNTDIDVPGFSESESHTVYLHVSDRAGNVTSTQLVANPSKMDASAPKITHAQAWSESKKCYKTIDDDYAMTVKIEYPAAAETASGVKYIKITGNLADPGAVKVYQDDSAIPLGSSYTYNDPKTPNALLITLDTPITLTSSGCLYVKSMKVSANPASYTVTLLDAVENASSGTAYAVSYDGTAPESLSLTLTDGDVPTNETYSSLVARVYGKYTEAESQLYSLDISGAVAGFSSPTVVIGSGSDKLTYTEGGTTHKLLISGNTFVLDPPPPNKTAAVSYEVTGILLEKGSSDDDRSVSLSFTNTAELFASASDSITLDTTAPTLSIQLGGNESPSLHYPTEKILGSTTENTTATCWLKYGSSPAKAFVFCYGADTGGSGIAGYLRNGVTLKKIADGNRQDDLVTGDTIQAVDSVGNMSYAITMTVNDDSIPPAFSLKPQAEGKPNTELQVGTADVTGKKVYTKGTKLNFDFTVKDGDGSGPGSYKLQTGGAAIAFSSEITLSASVAGNPYAVTVLDNVSNESKILGLTVYQDTEGPAVAVTPPGSGAYKPVSSVPEYYTSSGSLVFTVTASDDAGVGDCTTTNAKVVKTTDISPTVKTFEVEVTATESGTNVTISITDALGNTSDDYSFTLKQDKDPPVITIKSPGSNVTPSNALVEVGKVETFYTKYQDPTDTTFILNATDARLKSFTINGINEKFLTSGSNESLPLAQGANTIVVSDYCGNSVTRTVTIVNDATPPTFTFKPEEHCTNVTTTSVSSADVNLGTLYTTDANLAVAFVLSDTGDSGLKSYFVNSSETEHAAGTVEGFTLPADGTAKSISVLDKSLNASKTLTVTIVKDNDGPTIAVTDPSSGIYKSGTTYFTQAGSLVFTMKGTDAAGVNGCTITGGGGAGTKTPAGTGEWNVTLPAKATAAEGTYSITMTDALNNVTKTPVSITVVQDITPIAIDAHLWYSASKVWLNYTPDTGSGIGVPTITGGGTATINGNQVSFSGISTEGSYTVTVPDKVGNKSEKKVFYSSSNIVMSVNMPVSWTVSGSGPYTIGNFGFDGTTIQSYLLENVTTTKTIADKDGTPSTISDIASGNQYRITFYNKPVANRSASDAKTMVITFTLDSAGSVLQSSSVLGSTVISERLSTETVNSTIRKQYFDNARSSSSTNLPVWYTDLRSGTVPSGNASQERTTATTVTAAKGTAEKHAMNGAFTANAKGSKPKSIEALHAAALSGMSATASSEPQGEVADPLPNKAIADIQVDIADEVIMTAPEGSPAFVAYARGLAALRDRSGGMEALNVDRSSYMVLGGTKRAGLWERVLAFFGVREKGGQGESLVGFAAN